MVKKELWWEDETPSWVMVAEPVDLYQSAINKRKQALKDKIAKIRRQAEKDIAAAIHQDRKERGVHLFVRRVKPGIIAAEEAEVEFRTFEDLVKTEEWIGSNIHEPHVERTDFGGPLFVSCKRSHLVLGYIYHTSDDIGIKIHGKDNE